MVCWCHRLKRSCLRSFGGQCSLSTPSVGSETYKPSHISHGTLPFSNHPEGNATYSNPATIALISLELIRSVQHLYFIVAAPAFFLLLGIVILSSDVLPRLLGYLALVLASAFAIAGIVTFLSLSVPVVVQASASIQVVWWLAAAIMLIVRAGGKCPEM